MLVPKPLLVTFDLVVFFEILTIKISKLIAKVQPTDTWK